MKFDWRDTNILMENEKQKKTSYIVLDQWFSKSFVQTFNIFRIYMKTLIRFWKKFIQLLKKKLEW